MTEAWRAIESERERRLFDWCVRVYRKHLERLGAQKEAA